MEAQPLVSVLMTGYNTAPFIGQAIQSVLDQTYQNWELLVADDCSTDNTRAVIDQFTDARIRKFHNDKNLHYLRTRNKLMLQARGELIALLDSDDLMAPEKLEVQVGEFMKDEHLAMCGTLVKYMSKEGKVLKVNDHKPLTYEEIQTSYRTKNPFTGSTIIMKANVWREAGGYRDFFSGLGYEDYDLTSRIVERYKSINIPNALYYYRQYPESTSRRDMLFNPFKLNGHLLIQHFIEERLSTGMDSLDKNDIPAIINFVMDKHKPYVIDPSLIYREVMWSYLHQKLHGMAFKSILKAIGIKPLKFLNYKALLLCMLISTGIIKE